MSAPELERRLVGAVPRVDLMPKEVRQRIALRMTRRIVILLVALALAVVIAGIAWAIILRGDARSALEAAREQTTQLQVQQAQFADLRAQQRLARESAELAAIPLADRLDWPDLVAVAIDALPASALVDAVSLVADSPISAVEQPAGPFTAPRIGMIELALQANDLAVLTDWLDDMRARAEFSEVSMLTVQVVEGWTATATLSLAPELTATETTEAAQ